MAFAKGRQAMEETPKAECLRRWPNLGLTCIAVYYNLRCEGYLIHPRETTRTKPLGAARSAAEAWLQCLGVLEERYSQESEHGSK